MPRRLEVKPRKKAVDEKNIVFAYNRELVPCLTEIDSILGLKQDAVAGPTSDRPSDPVPGERYYDTDLGAPIWWDGTQWVQIGPFQAQGAHIYLNAETETAISSVGAWTRVDGVTTLQQGDHFTMPVDGRIQASATAISAVHTVSLQMVAGAHVAWDRMRAGIGFNGNDPETHAVSGTIAAGIAYIGTCMLSVITRVTLGPGDYFEPFITNETDIHNIDVESLLMSCWR